MTAWHWIAIAAMVVLAWMGRWDIQPTGSRDAYALDRWTGAWWYLDSGGYEKLGRYEPTPNP